MHRLRFTQGYEASDPQETCQPKACDLWRLIGTEHASTHRYLILYGSLASSIPKYCNPPQERDLTMAPVDLKNGHQLPIHSADDMGEVDVLLRSRTFKARIHLEDVTHEAVHSFVTLVDLATILPNAIKNVHRHLYKSSGKPPPVRSVTLIVESMDGVAYTTGIKLDNMHKEIHLSLDYIGHFVNDSLRFRDECIGVIVHEMVHCWQHDCRGSAPGGLIEGIADYVRLKSGLAPPHWKKSKEEAGNKWDDGYQHTAYFLEWLEQRFGEGTISRMNDAMDDVRYNEKEFWPRLFDDSVDSLWQKYLKHWDEGESTNTTKAGSVASTEPELVELTEEEKAAAAAEHGNNKAQPFQA
jgi:hypothetical protein